MFAHLIALDLYVLLAFYPEPLNHCLDNNSGDSCAFGDTAPKLSHMDIFKKAIST